MSLIDDAAEYNILGTERDLARLRAMWLKEDRARCMRECDKIAADVRMFSSEWRRGAGMCSAAIRALPLDRGAA